MTRRRAGTATGDKAALPPQTTKGSNMKAKTMHLATLLMALAMALATAGCSSDDDGDGDNGDNGKGITGTWYGEADEYGIYMVLRLTADGQYEVGYHYEGQTTTIEEGVYRYDSDGETITFYTDNGAYDCYAWLDGGRFEIEGLGTFSRKRPGQGQGDGQDDGLGSLICGTWRHTFSTGYIQIEFEPDGHGSWTEYDRADGSRPDTEYFSYVIDSETRLITIYIGDETERYEVTEITKNRLCLRDLNEGDYGDTMTMTRQ